MEDLGRILPGKFLTSTQFKRWVVERNLDEVWSQSLSYVKDKRNYVVVGFDHDAADSKDALGHIVNLIFERQREKLPVFLRDLLSFYAEDQSQYVDTTEVEKDLMAAGYEKEEVLMLQ